MGPVARPLVGKGSLAIAPLGKGCPRQVASLGKGPTAIAPVQAMKDGDWICSLCGNHNYASRTVCNANSCGAPREAVMSSGPKGYGKHPGVWANTRLWAPDPWLMGC